jgi:hypothetical protein
MATTTIAFTVPISLSRAFDYVSNFERFPDWSGNILSFKKNESTSGFQVKVRFWFFPCKFEYRIIESKYPSRLVFRIKSRFSDQTETFSFYPDPKVKWSCPDYIKFSDPGSSARYSKIRDGIFENCRRSFPKVKS